ncbi:MAG: hypothetical protein HPY50_20845 [Firmicutes bacterium]|nr:hypothetical protein [Bacillota bacterium]
MDIQFNSHGVLPPGDYPMTFEEIGRSVLITGPGDEPDWDTAWRARLLDVFEYRCIQLWSVGVTEIFIVGSFVSDKLHPNDLDAYFVCRKDHWERIAEPSLKELDPEFWSFERINKGTGRVAYPMWFDYGIEIYPVYEEFLEANVSDPDLKDIKPEWFRKIKYTHTGKGVIKVIRPGRASDQI